MNHFLTPHSGTIMICLQHTILIQPFLLSFLKM